MPQTVTVTVVGGPNMKVRWTKDMTAQDALEVAYETSASTSKFTYALQYFGSSLGYLVVMINDTFETFNPSFEPNYYWEFLVGPNPSPSGIDQTRLNAGDVITFELQPYSPTDHRRSTVGGKHTEKMKSVRRSK